MKNRTDGKKEKHPKVVHVYEICPVCNVLLLVNKYLSKYDALEKTVRELQKKVNNAKEFV